MALRVVYSINARLGSGGIGSTAFHAVSGIYDADCLERVFVSSNARPALPAFKIRELGRAGRLLKYVGAQDSSGLFYHLESVLFDAWTARQISEGDIFHGWLSMCYSSLRRAKRLGMKTVIECASPHPATFAEITETEFQYWGVAGKYPRWNMPRVLAELADTDFINVPSAFARESFGLVGTPASKLHEIPLGVDISQFRATPDGSGSRARPFRAVFVGRLTILKGLPYLLEAWKQLNWHDAELWLVGQMAPDFSRLRRRWQSLHRVTWRNHTPNVAELYQQCDVCVFPSLVEGSALVTYEAMASGLPLITTSNAGSVARDGVEGFIVPIRDVAAICDRLQRLRDDAHLRSAMGRAGRERAQDFAWQGYGKRLTKLYAEILSF